MDEQERSESGIETRNPGRPRHPDLVVGHDSDETTDDVFDDHLTRPPTPRQQYGDSLPSNSKDGGLGTTDDLYRKPVMEPPRIQWRERFVLDTVRALLRHWILCAAMILLAGVAGGLATLLKPAYYVARAKIYPPPSESQFGALGLPGMAGLLGTLGINANTASQFYLYEQALMSRDLMLQLLDTPMHNAGVNGTVRDYLRVSEMDSALRNYRCIKALRNKFTYETDAKTGVTTIGARDSNPRVAALLVNRAVNLLNNFDLSTSARQAKAKREFIEGRLVEAGETLAAAEKSLEQFRSENVRIGNAPHLQLEAARLQREIEIDQQIYLTLRKEAELAQIEEQRSVPVVNVLERAEPPVLPAGPSWRRNAALSGFLGGLFTLTFFALRAVQPRRLLFELGITRAPQ